MFAPDGFATWFEIKREIDMLTHQAFHANSHLTTIFRSIGDRQELLRRLEENAWYAFIDDAKSLGVANQSGIFLRVNALHLGLRVGEPTRTGTQPQKLVFVNEDTGLIDLSQVPARISAAEKLLDIHMKSCPDEIAYPNTLTEENWAALETIIEAKKYLSAFSVLEGWSLCCKDTDTPLVVLGDFVEAHENYFPDFRDEQVPLEYTEYVGRAVGRPRLDDEILAAFNQKFSGTEQLPSVSQIARTLGYDRKTVRNLLKAKGIVPK